MRRDLIAEIEAKRAHVPERHKPDEEASVQQTFVDARDTAPAPEDVASFFLPERPADNLTAALGEETGQDVTPPASETAPQNPAPSAADKAAADAEYHEAVGEVHKKADAQRTTIEEQLRSAIGEGRDDKVTASGYTGLNVNYVENKDGGGNGSDRDKKRRAAERFLLTNLLNNGDLPDYIADEVFDDMSDAQITELVADIEAETGKPLEEYAAEVLGEEAAQRRPDESLVDYNRRMVKALGAEALNADGTLKEEYKGTALGNVIESDQDYQRIINEVDEIKALQAEQGASAEVIQRVDDLSSEGTAEADVVAYEIDDKVLKDQARVNQVAQTDQEARSAEALEANTASFGGFSAFSSMDTGELATQASAIDNINIATEFNSASQQVEENPDLAAAPALKSENDLTA